MAANSLKSCHPLAPTYSRARCDRRSSRTTSGSYTRRPSKPFVRQHTFDEIDNNDIAPCGRTHPDSAAGVRGDVIWPPFIQDTFDRRSARHPTSCARHRHACRRPVRWRTYAANMRYVGDRTESRSAFSVKVLFIQPLFITGRHVQKAALS